LWGDVVLLCEYKRKDGDEELDDVHVPQELWAVMVSLRLTLGRTQVPVEPATCDVGWSVSPSHIWHDYQKFHDESLVLLPLLSYCQWSIWFYRHTFIIYLFCLNRLLMDRCVIWRIEIQSGTKKLC
jgi:hypothetical protein